MLAAKDAEVSCILQSELVTLLAHRQSDAEEVGYGMPGELFVT